MGRGRTKGDEPRLKASKANAPRKMFKRVSKGRLVSFDNEGLIGLKYPTPEAAARAVREIRGMAKVVAHDARARADRDDD